MQDPHDLIPHEKIQGKGMLSGVLFLYSFWRDSILEGWANTIATERLASRERFAAQEAKTVQAENERMKARAERTSLLEPPLTIYVEHEENPDLTSNTHP